MMFWFDLAVVVFLSAVSLLIVVGTYLAVQAARGKLPSWVPERPPAWWPGQGRT